MKALRKSMSAAIARQMRGEPTEKLLRDAFAQQGYTLETFIKQVIEATTAEELRPQKDKLLRLPDWKTRTAARAQYMRLCGLDDLPRGMESEAVMDEVDDIILYTAIAHVRKRNAEEIAAEARTGGPRALAEQPLEVDRDEARGGAPAEIHADPGTGAAVLAQP